MKPFTQIDSFSILTPVGSLVAQVESNTLTGLQFAPQASSVSSSDLTTGANLIRQQLLEYIAGKRRSFSFLVRFAGTQFQKDVWQNLQSIPFGRTVTYGEVAAAIGRPKAVRAVGTAIGKNPIPVVVPCHRVLSAHGLGGFSGGMHWKRWLLSHEGILS